MVAKYHADHRELVRAIKRKWIAAHPEQMAAARKAWRDTHPENLARYRATSKKRNPIANRSYVRVRRVRKLNGSVIPFTPQQLDARLSMYGGRCWMCGGPAETIDHVIPLARGGGHILANLRPACTSCNSRKGSRLPSELVA